MHIREIKKGDKILHSHMGSNPPVSGVVKESPIQGRGIRSTLLVDVKGSEVGLLSMYKTVNWKTGPARARYNLELKKNIKSKKPQAASSKRLKKNTIKK